MAAGVAPPISVVVPSRDRVARVAGCLESIRASLRPGDELILADSASVDAEGMQQAAATHGARYLRCDTPGASRARNAGWRTAGHDIIAFVDDDVTVDPGWAEGLARVFAEHPEAHFVFGRLDEPAGPREVRPVALREELVPEVLDDREAHTGPGHSANMGVRRAAMEAVGGFDECLGPGTGFHAAEDLDLYDRLVHRGLFGRYEPAANGWHHQWRSRVELVRLDWGYGVGAGARIVKLLRRDRRRARVVTRYMLWEWGFVNLWRGIVRRKEFMTAIALSRVLGMLYGIIRCLPVRISDGHYRTRAYRRVSAVQLRSGVPAP